MNINDLRLRANRVLVDLGSEPVDPDEYELWVAERREAALLLAALADNDRELLGRTAAGEWLSTATKDLLLAAIQECAAPH